MSNSGSNIKWDAIREISGATITTAYQAFGVPLARDAFRVTVQNQTNGEVYISKDGATDAKKFPSAQGRIEDNKTNDMFYRAGTQFYIRYASLPVGATGWATLEVDYV